MRRLRWLFFALAVGYGVTCSSPVVIDKRPTKNCEPGQHVLTAVARDAAGNRATSLPVVVKVVCQ